MSFIAYLCWLLGISAPTECETDGYGAWVTDACSAVEEGDIDTSGADEGPRNAPPRHSRGTNIDVSI